MKATWGLDFVGLLIQIMSIITPITAAVAAPLILRELNGVYFIGIACLAFWVILIGFAFGGLVRIQAHRAQRAERANSLR